MYGFFKNKRIVLYDTLIQQVTHLQNMELLIDYRSDSWEYYFFPILYYILVHK